MVYMTLVLRFHSNLTSIFQMSSIVGSYTWRGCVLADGKYNWWIWNFTLDYVFNGFAGFVVQADLSKQLIVENIDSSSGLLIPFYDHDTSMVYLAGKVLCNCTWVLSGKGWGQFVVLNSKLHLTEGSIKMFELLRCRKWVTCCCVAVFLLEIDVLVRCQWRIWSTCMWQFKILCTSMVSVYGYSFQCSKFCCNLCIYVTCILHMC